ncbi:MAG: hypothetical protein K9K65_11775 [Desulfarculaceae bacterium]|nr:hypothetical protein [Desulfarculaceae bacterium]
MATWSELIRRQSSKKIMTAALTLARDNGGLETTTLRLSTHGIRPDMAINLYRPRLAGVPSLSQAIQEPFTGQSQITYGQLEIINRDAVLDEFISGWSWTGQPVVIALGFPELVEAQYQAIFTGRMKQPEFTDGKITVPIVDYQQVLLDKKLTAGDYTDNIPNLVSTCLSAAGITSIDSAAWSTWAAANNFAAYYTCSTDTEVSTVLDALLAPIGCWYTFDRAGQFVVATLAAPDTGAPDLTLVDDVRVLKFSGKVWDKQYWKLTVEYISSTDPLEYSEVSIEDSDILTFNPLATEGKRRTALTNSTDAATVRDRLWAFFKEPRRLDSYTAKVEPLALEMGNQVAISRRSNRYGISGNHRVVSFNSNLLGSKVEIGLLQ